MSSAVTDDDTTVSIEEAQLLWSEYQYRHDLCWKLIFQITIAVVSLLIIPYIKPEITKALGLWVLSLPALAILLVVFSWRRMNGELDILHRVREVHRARQEKVHDISFPKDSRRFTYDVRVYLIGLGLLGLADVFALLYVWSPGP